MKSEKRQQILGEIYEALRTLGFREYFDYGFTGETVVIYFPAENNSRFGAWDPRDKKFKRISEKYKYVYQKYSTNIHLEKISERTFDEQLGEISNMLGELVPKLVSLGLKLNEINFELKDNQEENLFLTIPGML